MGRLMRAKDWRGSGLGMPASWPASTKTAVSICLNSLFPMILWLGPELRIVYNDAYIPFLGHAKHPRVLGLPGKDAWSEIWSSIAPLHARVYAGQAVSVEDSVFFFNRHCTREEVYVTFSYSPILSADGDVEGVFCACTETTGKIVAARRLETLHTIGARALGARNVADACVAAAVALVGNTFDLPFAAIYLLDDERRAAVRVAGTGLDPSPLPERVHPDGPSWLDRAMHDALSGAPTEVVDVPPDERLRGGPWDDEIKQAVVVPITGSSNAPVALLVAGVSTRRPLDSDYAHFYGLLAGHVSKAIVDGQAYDVERRRAETLAEIDQAKTVFFPTSATSSVRRSPCCSDRWNAFWAAWRWTTPCASRST
ncbi:GAF domain-containing protein [Luteibacter sp. PPL201]|uniref:GAF domain-containing protein n=1 Tax=Luteibacter sahnii TaxID=3021977 RepID=A0ABT6BBQ9_9GAMM